MLIRMSFICMHGDAYVIYSAILICWLHGQKIGFLSRRWIACLRRQLICCELLSVYRQLICFCTDNRFVACADKGCIVCTDNTSVVGTGNRFVVCTGNRSAVCTDNRFVVCTDSRSVVCTDNRSVVWPQRICCQQVWPRMSSNWCAWGRVCHLIAIRILAHVI